MTKHRNKGGGGYDRRAIMKNAHKRFRDGRRLGIDWTFAQCLRTAWRAARIRQGDETAAIMRRIAAQIDDHLSRRITLSAAIKEGMNHDANSMGLGLLCADNRRRMADGRRTIC